MSRLFALPTLLLLVVMGSACGPAEQGDETASADSSLRTLAPTLRVDQTTSAVTAPGLEYAVAVGEGYPHAKWLLVCFESTVPGGEPMAGYGPRLCGPWYSGNKGRLDKPMPVVPGEYFVTVEVLKSYYDSSGTLVASGTFTVLDLLPY